MSMLSSNTQRTKDRIYTNSENLKSAAARVAVGRRSTGGSGGGRVKGGMPSFAGSGNFMGGRKPVPGSVDQHSGYSWAKWAGDINEPGSGDYGHKVHAWKSG